MPNGKEPSMVVSVQWHAPGRINLIGEHTDYNSGLALPFAIEQGCTATVAIADGFRVSSAQIDATIDVPDLDRLPSGWVRYALGPAKVLRDRGVPLPALSVHLDSDVPIGAGLSSSAAVVCSVTTALDDLLGLGLSADELLAVSRAAENDVAGAPTGGLDQLASLRGQAGHALLCDFADLSTRPVPLDLDGNGLSMLVVDTQVRHGHAGGEYAERRAACEEAARLLGVASLREVGAADVGSLSDAVLRRRARHVVIENARVSETVALLDAGRVRETGPLLSASHASLRDDFEVTTPELDLAAGTLERSGALGARMTGGGFGGCVIAPVDSALVDAAGDDVRRAFAEAGFRKPTVFTARPAAGAVRASAR